MQKRLATTLLCLLTSIALSQGADSKFQRGTIMAVSGHQESSSNDTSVERYDVDVKVGNTIYTVLLTQPAGKYGVQYRAGLDLLVRIKEKTIVYNDLLGHANEAPILSHRPATQRNEKAVPEPNKQ